MKAHESDFNNQESESTSQKEPTPFSDCVSNLNEERHKQMESLSVCFQPNVFKPDLKIVSCKDSLL